MERNEKITKLTENDKKTILNNHKLCTDAHGATCSLPGPGSQAAKDMRAEDFKDTASKQK